MEGVGHRALKLKVARLVEALARLEDEDTFAETIPRSKDDYYLGKIRLNALVCNAGWQAPAAL